MKKNVVVRMDEKLYEKFRKVAFKARESINKTIVKAAESSFKRSKGYDCLVENGYKDATTPTGRTLDQ